MISSAERAWFPVTSTVRMVRDPTPNSTRHSHQPRQQGIPLPKPPEKKRQPPPPCHLCLKPRPLGQSLQLPGLMGGGLDHQGKPVLLDHPPQCQVPLGTEVQKVLRLGPCHLKRHQAQQPSQPSLHRLLPPYSSSSLSTQPVIRISPPARP